MVDSDLEGYKTPQRGAISQKRAISQNGAIMTVSVSVFLVELREKKTMILLKTNVEHLVIDITKTFGLSSEFDAVLYCVNNFWSKEIVDVLPQEKDPIFGCSYLAVPALCHDDNLEIRRRHACIGPALRLDFHAQRDLQGVGARGETR